MAGAALDAVYVAFFAPLVAIPFIMLSGVLRRRRAAEAVSVAAAAATLAASVYLFARGGGAVVGGGLALPFLPGRVVRLSFYLDTLSRLFALIVGLIGFLVVVYSVEYMSRDSGYVRYYGFLMLFIAAMEGLVLTYNMGALYVFWEAVGLCSFALIGHYYESFKASRAGVKAFVTTRFADIALLAAVAYLYHATGGLSFSALRRLSPTDYAVVATLAFAGAVGKSAQLPLHVWLPDAMEGPTPVSALIHAATMVKAGIYLVARLVTMAPGGLHGSAPMIVAWVGAATALYAAICASAQYDAKRLLAYSTISQLGYIFATLGAALAGYSALDAALGHVVSHAVFKALLFLVAGIIIHELEPLLGPEQARDMRFTAGVLRGTPIVAASLAAGALSLAGVPPFAGAWSKEAMIAATLKYSPWLGLTLLVASVATAFYALKLLYYLVIAKPRHEELVIRRVSPLMWVPVAVLAVLTVASPFVMGWPKIHFEAVTAAEALTALGIGVALVAAAYWRRVGTPQRLWTIAFQGMYIDWFYTRVLVPAFRFVLVLLSGGVFSSVDVGVEAAAGAAVSASEGVSRRHRGRVSSYFAAFILGIVLILAVVLAAR